MHEDGESDGPEAPAFEEFFVRVEPRLRAALTSLYGADLGREATAEALAWAFESRRILCACPGDAHSKSISSWSREKE